MTKKLITQLNIHLTAESMGQLKKLQSMVNEASKMDVPYSPIIAACIAWQLERLSAKEHEVTVEFDVPNKAHKTTHNTTQQETQQ